MASGGDTDHRENSLPWYAEYMLRGSFQRAAMAILLIGLMIAPICVCLQQPHKSAHSCCMRQSESSPSLRADCCVVKAQLPATVVAPTLPGAQPLVLVEHIEALMAIPSMGHHAPAIAIPPLSPPPGAFILRI